MFFEATDAVLLNGDDEIRLAETIEAGVTAEHALADRSFGCRADPADLERVAAIGRAAQDEFFIGNLPMVASLAHTWADRAGVAAEELFQEGCVGLGRAIRRWDHRRGYRFSSLAWPIVETEISRAALRRCGAIEASIFRLRNAMQLRRSQEQLEMLLGREVAVDELADYLGRDVRVVAEAVRLSAPGRLTDDLLAVLPDQATRPGCDEMHPRAKQWLDKLPRPEADILRCTFGVGEPPMTRAAVAARMGLSVSTIRRLEQRGLTRLRTLMKAEQAA
ncbi:sigma-70 family RNA polymerase sigma factor [Brooklawnia sp.]|uniref:sigma-70 family RNA polymerase sigma factor n=1 Tax=Brooklawnia sp. TaxID=2699740 RepID=UPI00311E895E